MQPQNADKFNNATAYERYVGRWSREIGKQFIDWLAVPPQQVWLDFGSGTGILSDVILQRADPKQVIGVDISHAYVELAQNRIHDPRVRFHVGELNELALSEIPFDVAVAGLVLNFIPSPEQAIQSMAQRIKPGGVVAAYVWDYADKMEMMRHFWDAAIAVDPAAKEADAGKNFDICHPDKLKAAFEAEGLKSVEVIPIDTTAVFNDIDDYWTPFQAAQGSVSKYLRSLSTESRQAIYNQLQKQLPFESDGTIHLLMRAWAAKGTTSPDA